MFDLLLNRCLKAEAGATARESCVCVLDFRCGRARCDFLRGGIQMNHGKEEASDFRVLAAAHA